MEGSYVATGEVTTLEHELGNDAVEGRALVAESLLASAESAEVLGSLGDNIVKEVEVDATLLDCNGKLGQRGLCIGTRGRKRVASSRAQQSNPKENIGPFRTDARRKLSCRMENYSP